ncbi:MAG: hypothetical protein AAB871_02665 [Patescibacteria group bacterium]
MQETNKNSAGLAVGLFFGLAHLAWVILVALNLAKPLTDWVLGLHFITLSYSIKEFSFGPALLLVVVTFVCGYVAGFLLAAFWNLFRK